MKLTREELRLSYNAVCNAYLAAFCEKHGYDYEPDAWVGDDPGGIAEVGDLFVSMADMLTDIDRDAPEEEYIKYYDYCMRVGGICDGKLNTPNYDSWLRGCPRMDEEQIARLESDCKGVDSVLALVDYGASESLKGYKPTGNYGGPDYLDLMMRDDDYLEKLARGEYGNHIEDKLEKVDPTIKENLTVDREHWRRVYAGYALAGSCARVSRLSAEGVKFAIALADALLEELEKKK